LTPAEEARSLRRLIEEFALTHQEAADGGGAVAGGGVESHPIAGICRRRWWRLIDSKAISMGHARGAAGTE